MRPRPTPCSHLLRPIGIKSEHTGSQTNTRVTWGLSKAYNQAAQVPSSKVTCKLPRRPRPSRHGNVLTTDLVRDVVMLTGALGRPPKHTIVSSQPDFSPSRRSFPTTLPCGSTSPACPCSCANSLRFGLPSAELRCGLPAEPAPATTGRRTPLPRLTVQATQSFAGSAHSAHSPEPTSPRRFRSASETASASIQKRPGRAQFLTQNEIDAAKSVR